MRLALTLLIALWAPSLVAARLAAEEVENPVYKSWARFPPGTVARLRSLTVTKQGKIETTSTYELISLNDRVAVVDMVVVSDATGTLTENPPHRFEHRRMLPLLPGMNKDQIGKPSDVVEQGAEELTVAGKTYKTVWFDSKSRAEAGEVLTRTWMSDEVPGKIVRAVTRVPSVDKTTTLELVELKTP